jgi:hypothetical protein
MITDALIVRHVMIIAGDSSDTQELIEYVFKVPQAAAYEER